MNSNFLILCIFFVDENLKIKEERNSQNKLSVSEIVMIGILYALKGVGQREFYRWLKLNHVVNSSFHACEGDPKNMKVCKRGKRNERKVIETVFSMMTRYFKMKHISFRV